jgi:predicted permease
MRWMTVLRLRLRSLFQPGRVERELDKELRYHVERLTNEHIAAGMTSAEARYAALREMGGLDQAKEACRDALGRRLFDELRGDLRYTWRQLRRSPAFTTIAILSLALGIGANTAIFSLLEAALWKPMPVRDPHQLRLFTWTAGPYGVPESTWDDWNRVRPNRRDKIGASFSYAVFKAFEHDARAFERVFAFKPIGRVTALVGDQAELVVADLVSGGLYEGIGVVPIIGRPILPSDDQRGRTETVAVISDGYWARRFGRDADVIGRSIRLNQVPVTIVGVNPPGFTGLSSQASPDLFMPLTMQPVVLPWRYAANGNLLDDPDYWWVDVMGRLKPGVTDAEAQAATHGTLQQTVRATLPSKMDRAQPYLRLLPGARGLDNLAEDFGWPLIVLLSLVGVLLLIACANVANLLLARASVRRRELSLRLALGAGRARLTRQLLTEGLVLGLVGGALGVLLGYWVRDVIPSLLLPSWAPERFGAVFDLRVLALALAVTIATSVLFSLVPIGQALGVDVQSSLKDGGRTMANVAHPMRGRSLVVFQVSLSVLLLIGAALFLRTLANLRSVELGFRPEQVLLFTIDPPRQRYVKEARKTVFEQIDGQVAAIPGVEVSSLSANVLVGDSRSRTMAEIVGRTPQKPVPTFVNIVGYRFFETMGLPIIMGRSFDAHDRRESPKVAIVNQQFVRKYLPNDNPIGRRFKSGNETFEIVGVCGDTHYDRVRSPVPPTWFGVLPQAEEIGAMTFEVRTAASVSAILPRIREAARAVDKDLPVFDVRTQLQQIDSTMSRERLFVTLTSAFGVLALILASVGIYGILAQNVSRRTGEIGIRVALGAARANVLVMVLREASLLAVIGVIVGAAVAVGLGRYVESILFGVTPIDPIAIGGAAAAMLIVALMASWVPARRACRLDPMVALRHE